MGVSEVASAKGSEGTDGLSCASFSTPGGLLAIMDITWLLKHCPDPYLHFHMVLCLGACRSLCLNFFFLI